MKVEVQFSVRDLATGAQAIRARRRQLFPAEAKRIQRYVIAFYVLLLAAAVLVAIIVTPRCPINVDCQDKTSNIGIAIVATTLAIMILYMIFLRVLARTITRVEANSSARRLASKFTYEINEDGFTTEWSTGSGLCRWEDLKSAESFRGFIIIFFWTAGAIAIPENRFATSSEALKFLEALRSRATDTNLP
jgi:hypothetical protein